MKHILITTIAAVLLVGCGESQQSTPTPETKPEPAKAPDISIHDAVEKGKIEAVKQHLAAGTDVNARDDYGRTPLHGVTTKEIAELLIAKGADANAAMKNGRTALDMTKRHPEIAELLRKHGGKTGEELKAEGK